MATEVDHADLTGAALHPPLGTSESASALAIADVNNSILIEDSSGYDITRVNLVDDEIVIGSSSRPIALKVYDSAAGADVSVATSRTIARIPTTTSEVARWDFNGALTDSVGSFDLTAAGTAAYTENGLDFGRGTRLRGFSPASDLWANRTSSLGSLIYTGALTINVLCVLWPNTTYQALVALSGSGASETEADNNLGYVFFTARGVWWTWEYSTGTDAGAIYEAPPFGRPCLLSFVRDASGNAAAYCDGAAMTVKSTVAVQPPTGGTSAVLRVGIATDGSSFPLAHGTWIGGIQWVQREMSAADILAHAQAVGVR